MVTKDFTLKAINQGQNDLKIILKLACIHVLITAVWKYIQNSQTVWEQASKKTSFPFVPIHVAFGDENSFVCLNPDSPVMNCLSTTTAPPK